MFARPLRSLTVIILSAATLLAAFPLAASAQDVTDAPAKSLESLLSQTNFMYRKLDSGLYRIAVERDAGMTSVMAEEVTMSWKDNDGNDVKRILIYCWISDTPEGFVANRPLLEKVVEMNRGFQIGRIDQNKNGFFFTTGIWTRTADVQQLTHEIYIAANTGADAINALRPLIEQSGQTKIAHQDRGVQ